MTKTCLVTGVGPGTGLSIVKKFGDYTLKLTATICCGLLYIVFQHITEGFSIGHVLL